MDENTTLHNEQSVETGEQSSETDFVAPTIEEILEKSESSKVSDVEQSDDQETFETETEVIEDEIEDTVPTDTVIQVKENEDSETGYDVIGLDVESLNKMSESYLEANLSVTPSSNDYYDFISGDVLEFFTDIMANYPLNDYQACHLRHYISSSQYYSYYDDYYYLWYDIGHSNVCVEVIKYRDNSTYTVNYTTANVLNSSITYGSDYGQADFRKGVSYVQEMAFLCSVAGVLILYIVNAIFRHLRR